MLQALFRWPTSTALVVTGIFPRSINTLHRHCRSYGLGSQAGYIGNSQSGRQCHCQRGAGIWFKSDWLHRQLLQSS
jgi:hypothetical protein